MMVSVIAKALQPHTNGTLLSLETVRQLYDMCLARGIVFPGLDERRSRQSHTSEQKLWSIGFLIDSFLFPYLADNKCWDKHFNLEAECFVLNIEGVKLVQGAFVMPHFSEYLILGGLMKDCSEGAKHGPNSQRFLDMCDGLTTWDKVLTEIKDHLVFEANWRDCSSSACMVIRLLESLFAGSTKGKGYKQEMIAVRSELHKPLQAYLKGFAC
jgi:hypothetical protein